MKKSLIIPLVSVGVILASASSILLANSNHVFSKTKAGDGKIEISMSYLGIKDDEILYYTEAGYNYAYFIVSTKTATNEDYLIDIEAYSDDVVLAKVNNHILEISDSNDDGGYYGGFDVTFEFSANTSNQKVTINGDFQYGYKPATAYETVNATDRKAKFNIQQLRSCYISSIDISYYCG